MSLTNYARPIGWVLFTLWVGLTGAVLYYLTFGNYGEFDPEQDWLQVQTSPQLNELGFTSTDGLTLIHIRDPYCSCNPLANAHISTVPDDVPQHWLSADELRDTGFAVPATPMALIFDGDDMIYAGPYASGPLCSPGNSLIETILHEEQRLAGLYLNGLIRTCRCLSSTADS